MDALNAKTEEDRALAKARAEAIRAGDERKAAELKAEEGRRVAAKRAADEAYRIEYETKRAAEIKKEETEAARFGYVRIEHPV
jgi:hypothetical protein